MGQAGGEVVVGPGDTVALLPGEEGAERWEVVFTTSLPAGVAGLVHLVLHLQRVGEVELRWLGNPVRHSVTTELPVEDVLMAALK